MPRCANLSRRFTHCQASRPLAHVFLQQQENCDLVENGERLALTGHSIAVKDIFVSRDGATTAASKMLQDYRSPFDSTTIQLLKQAGASVVGKTNMDEFGMGSLNAHSAFGLPLNPANPNAKENRYTGGSSGGSAAAVAAGLCDSAIASDTGGSTRLPAAYCGVFGFKPSYGLLSRWGMITYASSLDCVGIISRQTAHIEKIFNVLNVYDNKDPTAIPPSYRQSAFTAAENVDLSRLKIGIPAELLPEEISPQALDALRLAIDKFKSVGATIHSVSLPSLPFALSAYYIISSAEAASNLSRYDGIRYGHRSSSSSSERKTLHDIYATTRSDAFGPEVKKRILLGNYALNVDAFENYFLQAQIVRNRIKQDFNNVFSVPSSLMHTPHTGSHAKVDFLLYPSAIAEAPIAGKNDATQSQDEYAQDVLNVPASLAGVPACSVPTHTHDGWPLAVQLCGQWGADRQLLKACEILATA